MVDGVALFAVVIGICSVISWRIAKSEKAYKEIE